MKMQLGKFWRSLRKNPSTGSPIPSDASTISKQYITDSTISQEERNGICNTTKYRIVIAGNCQAIGISALMQAMTDDVVVKGFECSENFISDLRNGTFDTRPFIESDLVLMHYKNDWIEILEHRIRNINNKIKFIPPIAFSAFHPDCVYIEHQSKHVASPIGAYHSSLAFYGWRNGLNLDATLSLFCRDVYEELGFLNYWDTSVASLIDMGKHSSLLLDDLIPRWSKYGCWMHTINHPKLHVLADVARAALARESIETVPNVENYLKDNLAIHSCWPVYPEIGKTLGLDDLPPPYFKQADGLCPVDRPVSMLRLEEFVRKSFSIYDKYSKNELTCDRIESSRYQDLANYLHNRQHHLFVEQSVVPPSASEATTDSRNNPYRGLPDYQFWRRALEQTPMRDVDPVIRSGFTLNQTDKVATAGSCFAQHISRTLHNNGFNYYVSEKGEVNLSCDGLQTRNFGVFSARFGNIYTARQLIQLFDRAYSTFAPVDQCWVRADGKLVDPFRPQVEPEGFTSVENLKIDREKHFSAVREMFQNLDVFVFTLGLTEAWRSRIDGAVFPLAPGVVAGEMDTERYEFVNFTVSDVVTDLQAFVERLLIVNPKARMLLTVSPVPLIATYENRHVLVSTTYSKSVLRAAAEEICQHNPMCEYFPSYEIITGNYTKCKYFEGDLRSVKPEGVDHVMRLFLHHYSNSADFDNITTSYLVEPDLMMENARLHDIICDEDAMEN